MRRLHGLLAAINLLVDLTSDRALLELGNALTKRVLERISGLDDLRKVETLLWLELGLLEEVVVPEDVPRLRGDRRFDRLAAARHLNLSCAQKRNYEKSDGVELP